MSHLRVRQVAEVNPPCPAWDRLPDDAELTFVPLEAVWPRRVDVSRVRSKADTASGYTRFQQGDVLIPKITPTFEADRSTWIEHIPTIVATGTTELHIVRARLGTEPRYLDYLFSSTPFLRGGAAEMIGVAGQKRVPDSWVRDFAVPIADPAEQRAIADYLDAETARIDALIAKKQQLVYLLRERFAALREESLWADATRTPLHRLTDPQRPIVYGIVQAGPEIGGGVPYIKTGDLGLLDEPERLSRTSHEIDEQYRRSRVHPGDIVVAMRASIGDAVLVPPTLAAANLTQGTARIAAAQGVDPGWLLHAFRSRLAQEQCDLRAVGSTFRTLNIWDLRRIEVPLPADHDFARIRRVLDEAQSANDRVIDGTTRQVDLLTEHRQALITAAVTGNFRLPGAA